MRALEPAVEGFVERDGVKVGYEVFGRGQQAVVFPPVDPIVHSRVWKAQVPYLARHARVVTIDPRGNGRSDRPSTVDAYGDAQSVADTIAVMDETGIGSAVLVGLCWSGWLSLLTAARHPDRADAVVAFAPQLSTLTPTLPERARFAWAEPLDTEEGWAKDNRHFWLRDYRGFVEFFFDQLLSEPHSSKQYEDAVGWALGTTPETLILQATSARVAPTREETEALLARVRCPVLTVHGEADRCQPIERSSLAAELTGGRLVTLAGAGHLAPAREPVVVNRLIREMLPGAAARRWTRPLDRPRRALFLSSPIGLGHAARDVAIARELRRARPGLQIDWLAQHPVTEVLRRHGERVHPASAVLAAESAHIEAEAGEHDLHAFGAIRRMDEILVANFMVFADLVESEPYDLWIGDEAWDLDHFLHENPELKTAPYAWLTDFVGWLPVGSSDEDTLTADYNAEMVEQVARFPRLRDRSVFVGDPGDLVPRPLGPGLPGIPEWTRAHFDFAGHVTGFDPAEVADRDALRAELGYGPDEQVCVVAVGGSGVGGALLRRVAAAQPAARALVPGLRTVLVTGPRIDPASVPAAPGLEVRGYVPDLYRHLAASDLAIVQGGLSTTMELTACRRPFLYVPLRNHFEQTVHVRHRLERHRAGRRLDYEQTTPDELAAAIAAEIGREVDYLPVDPGAAARAAGMLAELC
ncbi:MAG TPA: alpha/beta fold hydrolase [Mycobacteriales bacterium]|nr:alpha/beta fold hydrolase [Mycobacteriales bacterium]